MKANTKLSIKMAQFIREKYNIKTPIDPFKLLEIFKFNLEMCKFEDDNIDGETKFENDIYNIKLDNSEYCKNSKRIVFTLCHEFGHIFLRHFLLYDCNNLSYEEIKELDFEADAFAGEFLMPASEILKLKNKNINELSIYFNVSKECIKRRLNILYFNFYKKIGGKNFKIS